MNKVYCAQNSILKKSLLKSNLKLFLSLSTCQSCVNNCSVADQLRPRERKQVQYRTDPYSPICPLFLRVPGNGHVWFSTHGYVFCGELCILVVKLMQLKNCERRMTLCKQGPEYDPSWPPDPGVLNPPPPFLPSPLSLEFGESPSQ